uniref:Tenascin-R-like isoform X2 n=1 Tax=Callorhinus ursinus TaxID=34884 RepID=A0A3Q7PWX5_CALUR|nr:tenascin-R-like isoform X2 [Callorhinus ursinus]
MIIWTGLNDMKREGHLTWTDGSSFGLKKNEIFSFPLLPKNETDCYILQQNATGSNYFFSRFFCSVPLPYICKYESLSLQENLLIYIKDVGTTEVVFGPLSAQNVTVTHVTPTEIFLHWNPPDLISFHHYLVTILDVENNKSQEVLVEKLNTSVKIGDLKSFRHYLVYLFSVAERGTLSCFERPISAITGISPPQKVHAKPEDVGEDSIILQWESPPDGHEVYIQIKPSSDTREVMKLFVRDANRFKIDNLTPGMTYDIGMATVMNGNLSELVTIQQTLSENQIFFIHNRYLLIWGYCEIFPDTPLW